MAIGWACLAGCSSNGDGGGPDASAAADGGVCNGLSNDGPVVSKTGHPEAPPAMTGGTIADGTYILTATDQYNGHQGGTTHQEKWVFSGGSLQVVENDSTNPGDVHLTATYTTSSNVFTLTATCPGAMTATMQYTATATQFVTQDPTGDDHETHTYTRQ